ncbi:MAG: Uma2 family endonuclease [Bryobacteraceae bacterium]|nr:Uma2 family endonuclease [Bryobacteraceae bacterium]
MGSLSAALVTFEHFLEFEDEDQGYRRELHDGEVVLVPPARPAHVRLQWHLQRLLSQLVAEDAAVVAECPYKPHQNFQFWYADVAVVLASDWNDKMRGDNWVSYSPALIAEILSPSNRPSKINQQRIVAMSAGTLEFWVVDGDSRTVHVTTDSGVTIHVPGSFVPLQALSGRLVSVAEIFSTL